MISGLQGNAFNPWAAVTIPTTSGYSGDSQGSVAQFRSGGSRLQEAVLPRRDMRGA